MTAMMAIIPCTAWIGTGIRELQVWNPVGGQAAPNPHTCHGNLASKH